MGVPHPHTHFKDKVSDRIIFCARIGSNDESKGEGPFYIVITSPTQKRTDENGRELPEFCPDGAMVGDRIMCPPGVQCVSHGIRLAFSSPTQWLAIVAIVVN